MKKSLKIIISLLLVLGIVVSHPLITMADENEVIYKKGSLRCPKESNNKCTEIKDANGNVTEVIVTESQGGVTVKKHVSKTNELGVYDVWFDFDGVPNNIIKTGGDTYVSIVFDTSDSLYGNVGAANSAIVEFIKRIHNDKVKVSITQFASDVSKGNNFQHKWFESNEIYKDIENNDSNKYFCDFDSCSMDKLSHLQHALNVVNNLFYQIEDDEAGKYLIIFGDGRYWVDNQTYLSSSGTWHSDNLGKNSYGVYYYINEFQKRNVDMYAIQYNGTLDNPVIITCPFDKTSIHYYDCDEKYMRSFVGNNYYRAATNSVTDFTTEFLKVAGYIKTSIDKKEKNVVKIVDNLGSDFSLTTGSARRKTLSITNGSNKTEKFKIVINSSASSGWHKTNSGYTFTYTESGGEKSFTSTVNPEVYWIQENAGWESCSSTANSNSILDSDSSNFNYYTKECYEGYNENNEYINGFTANLNINNLENGTKSFSLEHGYGFPASLNINTNVKCTYTFDTEKFNTDYQDINSKINNSVSAKERAEYEKNKLEMDNILNSYITLTNNDLNNYKENFGKQSASFTVTNNKNNIQSVSFVNLGDVVIKKDECLVTKEENINGKSIKTNATCYLGMEKNMILPLACLEMKSGEATVCDEVSDTQLDGGNKFYPKLDTKSGKISVEMKNAGYSERLSIELKGENCSFNVNDKKLKYIYRQIDVTNPFVQKNNSKRSIGKNWSNSNYNFVKIIKNDIWNNEEVFKYDISKSNIRNIINDTISNQTKVISYLGTDCKIRKTDNKYICSFTRNMDEQKNFFTKVKINDE